MSILVVNFLFHLLIVSVCCSEKFDYYEETLECFPNHHPITEFWDAEDKELFKDTRTSFVSSNSYSKNCHRNYTGNEVDSRILNYFSRKKRDTSQMEEASKSVSSFYLDSIHNVSPQKVRQLQVSVEN